MGSRGDHFSRADEEHMSRALTLARRGYGGTSPNPMVGAVLVRNGKVIGEGWHRRAGEAHAEIRALTAATRKNATLAGASLYVTLEPCCTHGRTPPCTDAILRSGIKEVIAASTDPNPRHSGQGLKVLRAAGIQVRTGLLGEKAEQLNEAYNFWIVHGTPWIIAKCGMSLDGKIATVSGESKWITSDKARRAAMKLRLGADAVLAGINTIIRDDSALTLREMSGINIPSWKSLKRVVLDPRLRIPETARVLRDGAASTILVAARNAPAARIKALEKRASILLAPTIRNSDELDLRWVVKQLSGLGVTSLLVEGGGETHHRFFRQSLVNRISFFYAPLVIAGRAAPKSVAGDRTLRRGKGVPLTNVEWEKIGPDLLCTALAGS